MISLVLSPWSLGGWWRRLVHRLDRNVSGVMVWARSADAATWLASCFSTKSATAGGQEEDEEEDGGRRRASTAGRRRGDPPEEDEVGPCVSGILAACPTAPRCAARHHSAEGGAGRAPAPLLPPPAQAPSAGVRRVYSALLAGYIPDRKEGRIRFPVVVQGRFRQAVTDYRIRHTSPMGLTWVELEPITGAPRHAN